MGEQPRAGDRPGEGGSGTDDANGDRDGTPGGSAGEGAADHDDPAGGDDPATGSPRITADRFREAVASIGRPVVPASAVARAVGAEPAAAREALAALADAGRVGRAEVGAEPEAFYPADWDDFTARERVVVFPSRREIVVDRPEQYTRAQLAQFAHLVDTTGGDVGERGYLYRIRPEDVWAAPFDDVDGLLCSLREVLPRRVPDLESWITDQWKRAHQFRLYTHEEGYVVLEAASEGLLGNVAEEHLDDDHLRAPISGTEAWANADSVAAIKRRLYEAGYPVADERDLDAGDSLDVELTTDLRDYQASWVERFRESGSGVFVGPPGSGKTVAAIGALAAVGGETLVLVPSRELAGQWREELLAHTDLGPDDVGEYHGGEKAVRPVTIATYRTAGMDRHRSLFDSQEWGLILYDEVHHVPSPVYARSARLQAKHRLGLSATPVRESGDEEQIYTLIGPPIGADWEALFDAGFVAEPEVQIRYVGWHDESARNAHVSARGRERRRLAATNPAKVAETARLLDRHGDRRALVFVEYLDQGEALAAALDVPFVSGETPHAGRERRFSAFRAGDLGALIVSRVGDEGIDLPDAELAVIASGLGGSRRQGAQRAGRTMRPVGGALVYVLATRGSTEEEFARRQMRHLAEKGILVRETNVEPESDPDPDPGDGAGNGNADTDPDGPGAADGPGRRGSDPDAG